MSSCVYYFKSSDTVYKRKGEIYEFFHIRIFSKVQKSHNILNRATVIRGAKQGRISWFGEGARAFSPAEAADTTWTNGVSRLGTGRI